VGGDVNTKQIKVGARYRKNLGSLDDLAESIRHIGLIQPLIVDADGNLIAGHRRLAACQLIGMDDVPAFVATGLQDAALRIQAERDENTCRKNMTPSELVAIGMALEELERPKARERMAEAGARGGRAEGSAPGNTPLPTREIVGSALGMSGTTYQRARAVVVAAQDDDAPNAVREVAQEALSTMDAGGAVTTAYDKVRRAQKAAGNPPAPEPKHRPDTPENRGRHQRLHHRNAEKILPRLLSTINGIASAVEGVDFSGCRLRVDEIAELDAGVRVILAVRKTLKECSA